MVSETYFSSLYDKPNMVWIDGEDHSETTFIKLSKKWTTLKIINDVGEFNYLIDNVKIGNKPGIYILNLTSDNGKKYTMVHDVDNDFVKLGFKDNEGLIRSITYEIKNYWED
jgi:hypothetical protein